MLKIRIECGSYDVTLTRYIDEAKTETTPIVRSTLGSEFPGSNVEAKVTWERRDGDEWGPVLSRGEYRIRCVWSVE